MPLLVSGYFLVCNCHCKKGGKKKKKNESENSHVCIREANHSGFSPTRDGKNM